MTLGKQPRNETELDSVARRYFLGRAGAGIGSLALGTLLQADHRVALGASADALLTPPDAQRGGGLDGMPHFAPKAKRVIYLFQSGGPSQLDLYDHKPELQERFGQEVPRSVYPDERKTTMTSAQTAFSTAPTFFNFSRHGESGAWFSELLPHIAALADDICVVKSMHTEAINHDPAITFLQTGSQIPGRPSIGAWLSYGLGSGNADLPTFVAMSSRRKNGGQPLYNRLWGSGFLPSVHQGVKLRRNGDPVLDIYDPKGVDRASRRLMLDALGGLNRLKYEDVRDPEVETRIAQYELAFRMQTSVPELLDFSMEPDRVLEAYGPDVGRQGSYAHNCLVARRLAERGVRFIQLFHQGWDQHGNVPRELPKQCRDTDQPTAALLRDLKERGMLDETLVVWGGEFGRTVYSQGKLSPSTYGRDHHPSCFTMWLAGGGVQGGISHGETDDYSVNVVRDGVHVHDLHATLLHLLGIDHERLIYNFQGRDFRLTDVSGRVVDEILS